MDSTTLSTSTQNATVDRDPHGIWFPGEFRAAMEAALDSNLRKARLDGRAAERRSRREAARQLAAAVVVEEHRLEATPLIQLADWYSDAPRAKGEEQDTFADEADEELRRAAEWLRENPEPSQTSEDYGPWLRTFERRFGVDVTDADAVAFRTQDEILADVDTASYVTRDEAPAPKGYGMTSTEMRRQWMQNTRLRYADALRDALRRHRGLSAQRANEFPALRSEAQFARSVAARWRFVDELERHGVRQPDADTVQRLKRTLTHGEYRETYHSAYLELTWRRRLAEQGQLDRYRHELVG
jgi:hypothetical protein